MEHESLPLLKDYLTGLLRSKDEMADLINVDLQLLTQDELVEMTIIFASYFIKNQFRVNYYQAILEYKIFENKSILKINEFFKVIRNKTDELQTKEQIVIIYNHVETNEYNEIIRSLLSEKDFFDALTDNNYSPFDINTNKKISNYSSDNLRLEIGFIDRIIPVDEDDTEEEKQDDVKDCN